ncbi:MAG: GlsB/YeaQ/YmgE family stress response membrane protein [Sandaracinaceae bacterium]
MSILAWVVLGVISGFIASKMVGGTGKGLILDLVLGVVGAFVGGAAFHLIGQVGVTGFNLWSILVATVGAVLVLVVYHAVTRARGAA